MLPESTKTSIEVWVLLKLGLNGNNPKHGYGNPFTVMMDGEVYNSLALAQQAQTFEALKNGIKYEIFHLEFPV